MVPSCKQLTGSKDFFWMYTAEWEICSKWKAATSSPGHCQKKNLIKEVNNHNFGTMCTINLDYAKRLIRLLVGTLICGSTLGKISNKIVSYLNNIKTVAGIKKISLQAMNFSMFCWLVVSLSRRFLINIKLLGPTDYEEIKTSNSDNK